jgi:hypothetical protein
MRTDNSLARLLELALAVIVSVLASSSRVDAVPITYTMVIEHASGQLGSLAIDPVNHYLRFTFQGDTQDVAQWAFTATYPTSGYQIRAGTASVEVLDHTSSAVVARATFAPEDGIFVSIDNLNQGIGFGSFGVATPNASSFGEPIYPYAIAAGYVTPGPLRSFDLKSDFQLCQPQGLTCPFSVPGPGYDARSCVGNVEIPCGAPIALTMSSGSGPLTVNQYGPCGDTQHPCPTGYFSAVTHPVVPFTAFHATVLFVGEPPHTFVLQGGFTLGAASNGINPLTSAVTLQLGTFAVTLPPNSFEREGQVFVFNGLRDGVSLQMRIMPETANHYRFQVQGQGADLTGTAPPVTVTLTIGDDTGTTTAGIERDD